MLTDFHIDAKNRLWASAASEPDSKNDRPGEGSGPFRSAVYQLGYIASGGLVIAIQPNTRIHIEGLKVEGLTNGLLKESRFTIGTDDESFGGIWRGL